MNTNDEKLTKLQNRYTTSLTLSIISLVLFVIVPICAVENHTVFLYIIYFLLMAFLMVSVIFYSISITLYKTYKAIKYENCNTYVKLSFKLKNYSQYLDYGLKYLFKNGYLTENDFKFSEIETSATDKNEFTNDKNSNENKKELLELECKNCGATLEVSENEYKCKYCGKSFKIK